MPMTRLTKLFALVGLYAVWAPHQAISAPLNVQRWAPQETHGEWIYDGDFVLAPMRFIRFCVQNPTECKQGEQTAVVALDDLAWQQMNGVNQAVNARITPAYASAGDLDWSITRTYGDCNDYAVQKRHRLLELGWPASALSLAVVVTPFGEGHLVLTVRTDRGDVVLDNLRQKIVSWNHTGYRFIKRQSKVSPAYWVDVKGRGLPSTDRTIAINAPGPPFDAAIEKNAEAKSQPRLNTDGETGSMGTEDLRDSKQAVVESADAAEPEDL